MKMTKIFFHLFLISIISILLFGCSSKLSIANQHRNTQVETKMSSMVSLSPVSSRVVYFQINNKTGYGNLNFSKKLQKMLKYEGYKTTSKLQKASYVIHVNLLQLKQVSQVQADKILHSGFRSSIPQDHHVSANANSQAYTDIPVFICMLVADTEISQRTSSRWHRYQTRITSYTQKPNLNCEHVASHLSEGVAESIARMF